ncbi:MAG: sulfatase-like hydrolase/transferase [Thermoanaerobaculia bacterium]
MNPPAKLRRLSMAAAIAAAALASPQAPAQEAAPRRSVLLLVGDDHGLDLGCYGNPAIKTPHLDRLASRGTRFDWAFAAVASCSASRSVILTGLYNHSNGQFGHAHPPSTLGTHAWVRSLPRLLNERGLRTGVIGKLHVSPDEAYPFQVKHTSGPVGDRDVAAMAKLAREFLSAGDAPFFLLVGFGDPHRAARGFGNDRPHPGIEEVAYDPAKVKVLKNLAGDPGSAGTLEELRREVREFQRRTKDPWEVHGRY